MTKYVDFYVPVIDNYGDIGFALNLALIMTSKDHNLQVRFFSYGESLFYLMLGITHKNIKFYNLKNLCNFIPKKNIFTFFDYKLPDNYLSKGEINKKITQFGYFLLHSGIENLHGTTYIKNGNTITHHIPSLINNSGGVIINQRTEKNKVDFINFINLKYKTNISKNLISKKWVNIFVYKNSLKQIFEIIQNRKNEVFFIFDSDKKIKTQSNGNIIFMPFIEIIDFNNFLSVSDVNIVRGENSICTSLSYGKPSLWDIYKEHNNAHEEKINDFLNFKNFGENYESEFKISIYEIKKKLFQTSWIIMKII